MWGRKKKVVVRSKDLLVNHGRDQLILVFTAPTTISKPTYLAAGLEAADGGNIVTLTELTQELTRIAIEGWDEKSTKARVDATFTARVGVGDWREIGLFDAAATESILDTCNTLGEWTSGNGGYPQADTSVVREGTASLKTVGSHTDSFKNIANLTVPDGTSYTTAARFQLWYYINETDLITANVRVYLSSDGADPTANCYYFDFAGGGLTDGWNFLSAKFSAADGSAGSPNINGIQSCYVAVAKDSSATEYIDKLRIFEESGNMWARAEFSAANAVEKQWGEVRTVYWYLTIRI